MNWWSNISIYAKNFCPHPPLGLVGGWRKSLADHPLSHLPNITLALIVPEKNTLKHSKFTPLYPPLFKFSTKSIGSLDNSRHFNKQRDRPSGHKRFSDLRWQKTLKIQLLDFYELRSVMTLPSIM